jgi:hypothetical protein
MSSTQVARFGKRSETSIPDWPYFLNFHALPISGVPGLMNWLLISPNDGGSCCPVSLSSVGFGSNVSIWLGPPTIYRKITALAFGSKCGRLGASGLKSLRSFPASRAFASRARRYESASEPKPLAARARKSRRVAAAGKCGR